MITMQRFSERGQADDGWLDRYAVLEERNRLSREIHDTLVQDFAGILLHLEAVEGLADAKWRTSSKCLSRAKALAKSGLEDSRRMLLGLRPKSLEGATLSDALRKLAGSFSDDGGMACTFRARGRERDLPVEVQDELYRVAQEALCNVRKHSRATSASLSMGYDAATVVLRVKDNGQGFAAINPQAGGHGYGLMTMRERAQRLGGRVDISAAPGEGTEVIMSVPIPGKSPMERNNQ
jgi:signal transduction histidine kinase